MAIKIVPASEVRSGKGGGKRGIRYAKYALALAPILDDLKEEIKKNKTIRVMVADIAREMGKEYVGLNPTSLHWGIKYSLFEEGIVVETGTHKTGEKVLVMRARTEGDILPASLAKAKAETTGSESAGDESDSLESDSNIDDLIGETDE